MAFYCRFDSIPYINFDLGIVSSSQFTRAYNYFDSIYIVTRVTALLFSEFEVLGFHGMLQGYQFTTANI